MGVNPTAMHALALWILALGAIAAGVYLSVEEVLDRNWLARAGCFVVILGIWSGLGGLVEEGIIIEGLTIRRRLSIARARRRYRGDQEEQEKRIAEVQQRFDERLAAHQNKLKFTFGILEASLLMTGTLIWGFGDLIKYFIS